MAQGRGIVLLHSDAQVRTWLGAAGNEQIHTPHLDRLACEGTIFRQATACSGVCVPSRASLMTGRYPTGTGVADNHARLHPCEQTMGQRFAREGFETGYFGKTHFAERSGDLSEEGWQETFLVPDYQRYLQEQGQGWTYPNGQTVGDQRVRYWNFGRSCIPSEHYFEPVVTDRAIAWLGRREASSDFLCFISHIAPHGPFSPPEPYASMYDPDTLELPPRFDGELTDRPAGTLRWIAQNQKYLNEQELGIFLAAVYGLVTMVDDCVGRVIETLKANGQYDRTLILFASDHGDFGGKYGIMGKSWSMDDQLIRIPLIASVPGHRDRAQVSDALVQNLDLFPTMLDYAGLEPPKQMHGCSFLPLMRGEPNAEGRDAAFAYQRNEYSQDRMPQSMIRTTKWKFVASESYEELYDLANDPHEMQNLADDPEYRSIVESLRCRLLQWHVSCTGQFYYPERARFWEDETGFYDETVFTGERLADRSKGGTSATS